MRKLNKKQKGILRILHEKGVYSVEKMAVCHWEEIKKINDFETLYQEANRFLNDLEMEGI